jgi:hypothetical protein
MSGICRDFPGRKNGHVSAFMVAASSSETGI